jgi:hypothetical protein
MPYKSDKIKLPRHLNRRIKLTDMDKAEMRYLYYKAGETIRGIARRFEGKCCRRMVQMVLFPERYEAMKARHKAGQWWKRRPRKEQTAAIRATRRYKAKLLRNLALRLKFWTATVYPKSRPVPGRRVIRQYGTLEEARKAALKVANSKGKAAGRWSEYGEITGDLLPLGGAFKVVGYYGRGPL